MISNPGPAPGTGHTPSPQVEYEYSFRLVDADGNTVAQATRTSPWPYRWAPGLSIALMRRRGHPTVAAAVHLRRPAGTDSEWETFQPPTDATPHPPDPDDKPRDYVLRTPFRVQAMQWRPGQPTAADALTAWLTAAGAHFDRIDDALRLVRSTTTAEPGWWVCIRPDGWVYALPPDQFEAEFRPAGESAGRRRG